MILNRDLQEGRNQALPILRGGMFQAEGRTIIKALSWEYVGCVQRLTRRPAAVCHLKNVGDNSTCVIKWM